MPDANKQSLLNEIRESEGKQANATPLAGLIRRWLECPDSQQASSALARALSLQGSGDPVYPRIGYLANPASLTGIPKLESHHSGSRITFGCAKLTALAQTLVEIGLAERIRLDRGSERLLLRWWIAHFAGFSANTARNSLPSTLSCA